MTSQFGILEAGPHAELVRDGWLRRALFQLWIPPGVAKDCTETEISSGVTGQGHRPGWDQHHQEALQLQNLPRAILQLEDVLASAVQHQEPAISRHMSPPF